MTLKLLIADDDSTTRRILTRAIALLGHEVFAAKDGKELIAKFQEVRPDMILTDWRMPELDGVEAVQQIRGLPGGQDVFIVLSTGVFGAAETAHAIEAGADDYILKPISVPALRVLLMLSSERINSRRDQNQPVHQMLNSSGRDGVNPFPKEYSASFPGALVYLGADGKAEVANEIAQSIFGDCMGKALSAGLGEQAPLLDAAISTTKTSKVAVSCCHRGTDASSVVYHSTVWPILRNQELIGFGVCSVAHTGSEANATETASAS